MRAKAYGLWGGDIPLEYWKEESKFFPKSRDSTLLTLVPFILDRAG